MTAMIKKINQIREQKHGDRNDNVYGSYYARVLEKYRKRFTDLNYGQTET